MAGNIQWLNPEFGLSSDNFEFHAVETTTANENLELKDVPSLCGLRPIHGWYVDGFADENDKCLKCLRKLDLACNTCGGTIWLDGVNRITKEPTIFKCPACNGTGLKNV